MISFRRILTLAATLGLIATASPAQSPAAPDTLGRARLARLLLGFEYALRDRPPRDEQLPEISRTFDAATLAFFAGKNDAAARTIDSLIAVIDPDSARRAAYALTADRALAQASADRLTLRVESGAEIPYRLRVPAGAAHARGLVVALHGAGGDERMWFEAYGAGMILSLAAQRDLVVVTPLTTAIRDAATLDALVEAVATRTPIDRRRVVLLGHSLGAITAWRLAPARSALIAGVVCLAGPCGSVAPADTTAMPPLFLAAGALDPLGAPGRLEAAAKGAIAAGRAVDFRIIPSRGHTMMVSAALPAAFEWIAARVPSAREYRRAP